MKNWAGSILAVTSVLLVSAGGPSTIAAAKNSGHATEKEVAKAPSSAASGKVMKVDAKAKTFEIAVNGKPMTFSGAKLKALPKVGDAVEVHYTQNPGGPLEATNFNLSRSNSY